MFNLSTKPKGTHWGENQSHLLPDMHKFRTSGGKRNPPWTPCLFLASIQRRRKDSLVTHPLNPPALARGISKILFMMSTCAKLPSQAKRSSSSLIGTVSLERSEMIGCTSLRPSSEITACSLDTERPASWSLDVGFRYFPKAAFVTQHRRAC
ncbi:uncharacterized protein EI90DRAFT_3029934 [Cantharellus anzutake]|uniref:uncharacterized protein n=1 Tax=Cantharellus anzutake TaxID=1750568 RepID=UPI0019036649|nr:uncharacterized protein EI90DRAFT_3029934 [Cantharellus anzutake]KAF8342698.1 hypothetical protein EI90DRAFT_3029934 [Cantharellus anzutake]